MFWKKNKNYLGFEREYSGKEMIKHIQAYKDACDYVSKNHSKISETAKLELNAHSKKCHEFISYIEPEAYYRLTYEEALSKFVIPSYTTDQWIETFEKALEKAGLKAVNGPIQIVLPPAGKLPLN